MMIHDSDVFTEDRLKFDVWKLLYQFIDAISSPTFIVDVIYKLYHMSYNNLKLNGPCASVTSSHKRNTDAIISSFYFYITRKTSYK